MEHICFRVHQCSMCFGDTHFICTSCQCELCLQCKENHINNLKTIDHNVVIYRKKFDCVPIQMIAKPHSDKVCGENLKFVTFLTVPVAMKREHTDRYMMKQYLTQNDNYTKESSTSSEVRSSLTDLFS